MLLFVFTALLPAIDPEAIGRVDHSLLPQQTLMELFLNNPSDREAYTSTSEPKDLSAWKYVKLNADGYVVEITFHGARNAARHHLRKRVPLKLEFTPQTVQTLRINRWPLAAFHLDVLPDTLETLSMICNKANATFDAKCLPRCLVEVYITQNGLKGSCDAESLPRKLEHLDLSSNVLSGSIAWKHLPKDLQHMCISKNALTGCLAVSELPHGLTILDVSRNAMTGSVDFPAIPLSLENLMLHNNQFFGEAFLNAFCAQEAEDYVRGVFTIVDNRFEGPIRYDGSRREMLIDKWYPLSSEEEDEESDDDSDDGPEPTPHADAFLYCTKNSFSSVDWEKMSLVVLLDARENKIRGSLDIGRISPSMRYLHLCRNEMSGSLDLGRFGPKMTEFRATRNNFSGTLCLKNVPKTLRQVDLSQNLLSGTLTLTPNTPSYFFVASNQFTDLKISDGFLERMTSVSVARNRIVSKRFVVKPLPREVSALDLRGNKVSQCLDLRGRRNRDTRIYYDLGDGLQRKPTLDPSCLWVEMDEEFLW